MAETSHEALNSNDAAAENYEIIKAPRTLQAKARVLTGPEADMFNPIGQAEDALEKLSVNFEKWLNDQVDVLREAHMAGLASDFSEESMHHLFRAAHDLRGQAATLGYPLAGEIAGSLCHLFDHMPKRAALARDLVRLHVDAIRAVVAEKASDKNHATGRSLAESLRAVTEDIVAAEIARSAA